MRYAPPQSPHIGAIFISNSPFGAERIAAGVCFIWNHTINLPDLWNHTFNLSDHWNHTINLPDLSLSFLRSSTFLANGNISCRADDWRSFPHKIVFFWNLQPVFRLSKENYMLLLLLILLKSDLVSYEIEIPKVSIERAIVLNFWNPAFGQVVRV